MCVGDNYLLLHRRIASMDHLHVLRCQRPQRCWINSAAARFMIKKSCSTHLKLQQHREASCTCAEMRVNPATARETAHPTSLRAR